MQRFQNIPCHTGKDHMSRYLILLFCLVVIAYSCKKNEKNIGDIYTSVYYDQTFCADKWATGTTDSITLRNVAHYLDSLQLYYAGLWMKSIGAPVGCNACFCKTGKRIQVSTFRGLAARYSTAGFVKE
jgi:hypothetical protein